MNKNLVTNSKIKCVNLIKLPYDSNEPNSFNKTLLSTSCYVNIGTTMEKSYLLIEVSDNLTN